MPSNVSRGAAWKARSRRWLESQGYVVVDLEIVRNMFTPRGIVSTKRDQLGADLMGVNADGYLWVQVKGYSVKRPSLAVAKRMLASYPAPPATRKVIVLWRLRAREPEIVGVP